MVSVACDRKRPARMNRGPLVRSDHALLVSAVCQIPSFAGGLVLFRFELYSLIKMRPPYEYQTSNGWKYLLRTGLNASVLAEATIGGEQEVAFVTPSIPSWPLPLSSFPTASPIYLPL